MVSAREWDGAFGVVEAPCFGRVEPEVRGALGAEVDRVLVLLAGEEAGGFAGGAVPGAVVPEGDGVVVLDDDAALVVDGCGRGVLVGGCLGQCRVVGDS